MHVLKRAVKSLLKSGAAHTFHSAFIWVLAVKVLLDRNGHEGVGSGL